MLKAIIATDLSDAGMLAVEAVAGCGRDVFAEAILVHVVDLDLYTAGGSVPAILEFAGKQLDGAREALEGCGIDARVRVEQGDTVETIEQVFAEERADLVVLTNLGKGASTGRVFGSTAEKLASRGGVPVLIDRVAVSEGGACCRAGGPSITARVLVAVGLDPSTQPLLGAIASLPATEAVRLLHVSKDPDDVRRSDQALAEVGSGPPSTTSVERAVLIGEPADTILAEAERWGATLIAIAACAHWAAHRLLWGSVARDVARNATGPVYVVPGAGG